MLFRNRRAAPLPGARCARRSRRRLTLPECAARALVAHSARAPPGRLTSLPAQDYLAEADNSTPVARRGRKARSLPREIVRLPKPAIAEPRCFGSSSAKCRRAGVRGLSFLVLGRTLLHPQASGLLWNAFSTSWSVSA